MRLVIIASAVAALLLIPVAPASIAVASGALKAQSTEFSAAKKKKAKRKASKVAYMRAVPSK